MANRLGDETSPYLRQHAGNPVDWYPWGDEAFERAVETNRPVFLSVGYSSCHWCHVMAHESFEDPNTAALMNSLFVNVKVDREERPDVDAVYMEAVQALTGRGGWPMSVWLHPDGRPFYSGTYFPPDDRPGMPAFTSVCNAVADAWRERPADVDKQADQLLGALSTSIVARARASGAGKSLDPDLLVAATTRARDDFDPLHGGFGAAPKFPHAMLLTFLASSFAKHHDPETERVLRTTLDCMAAGGIYDHVGGGFARYSTDETWLVPHFEKMLYDQALLVRAYLHGYLALGEPRWRRVVEETIDYVLRDLRHPDGGFFSAEDADSEGAEGTFYIWTIDEIRSVCGDDAEAVITHFGVTDVGNFEGRNILAAVDRTAGRSDAVERGLEALQIHRTTRERPGLDDKVLTEWNALFLRSLVEAAFAFDRADWLDAARTNANFLLGRLRREDGRLLRSWQAASAPRQGFGSDGRARHLAYAADHAALLEALVTLSELDDLKWIDKAAPVADALVDLFFDHDEGAFYTTGTDAEKLVVRPVDLQDNATPSANSLAASGLLRLAHLDGDRHRTAAARSVIEALAPVASEHPLGFGHALDAARRLVDAPVEVVLVGPRTQPETQALRRVIADRLLPGSTIVQWTGDTPITIPLLEGRTGRTLPTAYVCREYVCNQPVDSPEDLAAQLDALFSP